MGPVFISVLGGKCLKRCEDFSSASECSFALPPLFFLLLSCSSVAQVGKAQKHSSAPSPSPSISSPQPPPSAPDMINLQLYFLLVLRDHIAVISLSCQTAVLPRLYFTVT